MSDFLLGFGLLMFAAGLVVLLLWFMDPLRGPEGGDRP